MIVYIEAYQVSHVSHEINTQITIIALYGIYSIKTGLSHCFHLNTINTVHGIDIFVAIMFRTRFICDLLLLPYMEFLVYKPVFNRLSLRHTTAFMCILVIMPRTKLFFEQQGNRMWFTIKKNSPSYFVYSVVQFYFVLCNHLYYLLCF